MFALALFSVGFEFPLTRRFGVRVPAGNPCPDAQDAPVPETSRVRAVLAVLGPLVVLDRGTLLPISAPHGCVLEFQVEIHVR